MLLVIYSSNLSNKYSCNKYNKFHLNVKMFEQQLTVGLHCIIIKMYIVNYLLVMFVFVIFYMADNIMSKQQNLTDKIIL